MDLLDLWRGGLSYRRLWVLIQHLPPESATRTALRESLTAEELAAAAEQTTELYGRWSHLELLMGQLIDAIAMVQWTLVALKSKQPPELPAPFPRPGVKRRPAKGRMPTGPIKDYLEAMRAEHRRLVEKGGDDGSR